MQEFLFLYSSENLSNAGIERPIAEAVKFNALPPPNKIGTSIMSVLEVLMDALYANALLDKK